MLVNPADAAVTETTLHDVQEAARVIGLQIEVLNASTQDEIDAAFATLARERIEALFVGPDTFFVSRSVQFAILAAHHGPPVAYPNRDHVTAGGLMSYGTDIVESFRQVGVYTGSILKGAEPADLLVVQSTRFEFVINLRTAKALGLMLPLALLGRADEVIEQPGWGTSVHRISVHFHWLWLHFAPSCDAHSESGVGHFQTKSEAPSLPVYWSGPLT